MIKKKVSLKQMTLAEVLKDINSDVRLLKTRYRVSPRSPLFKIFMCAYLPRFRWAFPEGVPPYRPGNYEAGMAPTDLQIAIRRGRLDYFMPNTEIKQAAREKIFIQLLESIDPAEAKVLIAIKDQCLEKLFPNITYDVLAEAGYLPPKPKKPVQPPKEVERPAQPKSEPAPVPAADPAPAVVQPSGEQPAPANEVAEVKKAAKPRARRPAKKVAKPE